MIRGTGYRICGMPPPVAAPTVPALGRLQVRRCRREPEELLQRVPAPVVIRPCQLGADVAQVPGLGAVAGDRRVPVLVAGDPAVLPRVRDDPLTLGRRGQIVERSAATRARHDISGQSRLVLAETGPRAREVGLLESVRVDLISICGLLRLVGAEAALQ